MLNFAGLFEVYELDHRHHWVLRDWDGQVMARNGGYLTRGAALQDIELLRVTALTANLVEVGRLEHDVERADRDRSRD